MRKSTGLMVIVVLLGMACSGLCDQKESSDAEAVFDAYFREIMRRSPEAATKLGIPEALKVEYKRDGLTDSSIRAKDEIYDLYRKIRTQLRALKRESLTPSEALQTDVLLWHLDNQLDGEKYRYHSYIVSHMFGLHYEFTSLMTEEHPIESMQDAQDYITRLARLPKKIDQYIEQIKVKQEKGLIPPKIIFERTENQMREFIKPEVTKNPLYTTFNARLEKLESLGDADRKKLLAKAEKRIRKSVYAAYAKYADFLAGLRSKTTDEAGVWKLPDGGNYYLHCLKTQTTTSLTAEEIHQIGLKEVARIHEEMRKILKDLGITEGATMNEMLARYREKYRSEIYYPDTEESRKQVLKDYQKFIDDVSKKLPKYFSLIPKTPVAVKPIPAYKGALPPHYEPAPLDGSREGVFYASISNPSLYPNTGMQTLTYHEAIPGHHFQIAIERESPHSHIVRNVVFFNGYVEGWALYAEKLAQEEDWFETPHARLSNLGSELLRAVRLVLDTGLHYKKWTREQAFNYMRDNMGWSSYGSIDRYIVWPGQACGYKIGELKILELRERARKALSDKFDIKDP
ncbi:DUF885 family protein [Acidobacteriota bacterium]